MLAVSSTTCGDLAPPLGLGFFYCLDFDAVVGICGCSIEAFSYSSLCGTVSQGVSDLWNVGSTTRLVEGCRARVVVSEKLHTHCFFIFLFFYHVDESSTPVLSFDSSLASIKIEAEAGRLDVVFCFSIRLRCVWKLLMLGVLAR